MNPSLEVTIGKLKIKNPIMVASGTYGYGEEFQSDFYDISKLGAVVSKGISILPRFGNETPRVVETASGMLNAIGLANVGLEEFLAKKLPFLKSVNATVIVNIFGNEESEYEKLAVAMENESFVPAIEVNISCPNVKAGGIHFGTDPSSAKKITELVRKKFSRTLIVKLSPQVTNVCDMAKAVRDGGADAVSLINTFPAMAIDAKARRYILSNKTGGLSGPAIKPIALKMVHDVSRAVDCPVIGMGGIVTAEDAIEFLLAGAKALQIGTANFINPMAAIEIIDGIKDYMVANKMNSLADITLL